MAVKKCFGWLAAISAVTLAGSASATTTVVDIGTFPTMSTSPYFYITSGTPMGTNVHATFGATPTGPDTAFDYSFQFKVAFDGTGSGSLTTSFVGMPDITVTDVIINGTAYTPISESDGQHLNVGGILLQGTALNTIEVIGTNDAVGGPFAGTVAYIASVPEPTSWVTLILGFGFIGFALRRKGMGSLRTA